MDIYKKMEKLEAVRRQVSAGVCLIGIGVIIFFIAMGIFQSGIWSFIGLAIGVVGGFLIPGTHERYKVIYKDLFAKGPLDKNFDDVFYAWRAGFDLETVNNFQICKKGNLIESEDYVKAVYNGISFEMADVILKDKYKSSKSGENICFYGRIIVFDFPGKQVSSTRVFSKTFRRMPADDIIRHNKVEMESSRFNNTFGVYAEDAHDAFYLLTPDFMEQLERLQKKYEDVGISFNGNKAVVAFREVNDSFDKNDWIAKEVVYPEEIAKVQSDIDDIKIIIDMVCRR